MRNYEVIILIKNIKFARIFANINGKILMSDDNGNAIWSKI